jgi:transcriptional regulator with XRE-family HTH domain
VKNLSLLSTTDVQQSLCDWLRWQRKRIKLSRQALAERSTVPASTIKKFETTGQISLRQFLLLWQSVDDLSRLHDLTTPTAQIPSSIDEVLSE